MQADAAPAGAGVADDVGHRLAQRQRQRFARRSVQRDVLDVHLRVHTGGGEQRACALGLVGDGGTVAADRLAHLPQRLPRDLLDVANLGRRPRGIPFREAARQLRLEHDQREGVAEHVVQVAGDPLAFRDRGQVLDLLLRQAQLAVRPCDARVVVVHGAEQRRHDHAAGQPDPRHRREPGRARERERDQRDAQHGVPPLLEPRSEARGVDEKHERAGVDHREDDAERHLRGEHGHQPSAAHPVRPEVGEQEDGEAEEGGGPLADARAADPRVGGRRREEHQQVDQPDVRRPADLAVGREQRQAARCGGSGNGLPLSPALPGVSAARAQRRRTSSM
jgi:hypothetical protein